MYLLAKKFVVLSLTRLPVEMQWKIMASTNTNTMTIYVGFGWLVIWSPYKYTFKWHICWSSIKLATVSAHFIGPIWALQMLTYSGLLLWPYYVGHKICLRQILPIYPAIQPFLLYPLLLENFYDFNFCDMFINNLFSIILCRNLNVLGILLHFLQLKLKDDYKSPLITVVFRLQIVTFPFKMFV